MATLAALNLTAVALSAATAEAALDQAELERLRADAVARHERAVTAAQKAAATKALNKAFAGMKAEYEALRTRALHLEGAVAGAEYIYDSAVLKGVFPTEALQLLHDKKIEMKREHIAVLGMIDELRCKLPVHLRI